MPKQLSLYHGSTVIVDKPCLVPQSRNLDFGHGFYTTSNREQAKEFSQKVFKRTNSGMPTVNSYTLDLESMKSECKILWFERPDEDWLDFVCENRSGNYAGDQYDIVIGPVANDDVYTTIALYQEEQLTKEEALARLKIKQLYDQYVFCTEKALSFLRFEKSESGE